jgi:GTP-binding protein
MFVDKVIVRVKAGNGGDGAVSFRHEIYVDKGGPDGGNGGRGGSVILVADPNENTLVHFRFKPELAAQPGTAGSKAKRNGKAGENLDVKVPVGTQVYSGDDLIADLVEVGQKALVARGGDGGFGNAHFKSSTRQAPKVAELGEAGEQKELTFELKLLADVGLIGFPNAGKSTLLSVVSNAKPEIGDYPFTTLTPNLGVADIDDTSLLIADIPGLIEGASQGKGLGDEFLRHVERTQVLLHLIDIYDDDVAKAYTTITNELQAYSKKLATRPQIVVLTKIEGLPEDGLQQKIQQLKAVVPKSTPIFSISAQAHLGLTEVLRAAQTMVVKARKKLAEQKESGESLPVIGLSPDKIAQAWKVQKQNGLFVISGTKIEKFAARTNFSSEPGIRRIKDIMKKMGIIHELQRQGIEVGDTVVIGRHGSHKITF